jgi:hypothetical protein
VSVFIVPGLLDNTGGKRCHFLLLNKSWHLLPPSLSKEPGTVYGLIICCVRSHHKIYSHTVQLSNLKRL